MLYNEGDETAPGGNGLDNLPRCHARSVGRAPQKADHGCLGLGHMMRVTGQRRDPLATTSWGEAQEHREYLRSLMGHCGAEEGMEALAATLRARGEHPYVIPVGGSNAIGVFGYVAATLELVGQLVAQGEAARWLYYANRLRGTQARLALGARLYGASYGVRGVAVSGGGETERLRAVQIADEAAALLGTTVRVTAADLSNDDDRIGPGYGIATPACLEAIALLARHEAIFLDPDYSAKSMAGLIADIRAGALDPDEPVVFPHTGGTPALFAHAETLAASAGVEGA